MLNNEKIIKLRKRKALLEIQKKFYWFPVVKIFILDTGITRNPDEYMYDILWGVSDSRIVRGEEGVEETETKEEREKREKKEREKREKEEREKREKEEREKREKEEREKREKEEREEREERARMNKYQNMETSEIRKRLGVLQKINKSQRTEEENKELTSLLEIFASRLLTLFSGRRYKRESGDKDYIIDDVGVIDFK